MSLGTHVRLHARKRLTRRAHAFLLTAAIGALLSVAAVSSAHAAGKTVSLGKDRLWQDLATADGVILEPGDGGFPVLALRTDEYTPDAATDLLLHFDGGTPKDAADNYRTIASKITISRRWARLGQGSGVFQGQTRAVELAPTSPNALFAPGQEPRSFTIEFWLYPATLSDGETIFLWQGARKDRSTIVPQSIRCDIENGRITWTFKNFFQPPTQREFTVSLQSGERLIPRQWHHYTLRFDDRTGMIEYLVDGRPDAISYANSSGAENGTVFFPTVGTAAESRIIVGSGLTGFLDELRISRDFVARPNHSRYSSTPGTAITDPIDLGYTDSLITSITAVQTAPGNTGLFYYYRTANEKTAPKDLRGKWIQFAPNSPLPATPKGRYVQFKIELLPGGSREHTPTVADLSFSYVPRLPPAAPPFVTATPGNGQVTLSWRKVVDPDLKGYEVFYGDRPYQYLGTDSSSGSSPINVGNVTTFVLKGLTNGNLYYFAVVAYDSSSPPHLSAFSTQVAARPSAIAGGGQ